ncbi:uracil phosphoribosyltransferase [Arenibacter sp. GZD96]|uniref:DUF6341 family protein n=1 Tax=Aurantibrevibacter litoralis TaxID=3106030 RepID=UPI002AFDDFD9|nr:hypothetical protein [Arenibacter sp. GZD-96]MEA1786439.1 uracil phosphoribosyltransferase [Arenibacter sp. GZD-96]
MTAFFKGIEDLFVNFLFLPFDAIRSMENWWGANTLNWVFMLIGFAGMVYWMLQLKDFDQKGEEDKSITAHSYL